MSINTKVSLVTPWKEFFCVFTFEEEDEYFDGWGVFLDFFGSQGPRGGGIVLLAQDKGPGGAEKELWDVTKWQIFYSHS